MNHAIPKSNKIFLIALLTLLMSHAGSAGHVARQEVYVSTAFATGNMFHARYSSDTTQYIGCRLNVNENPAGDYIYCTAEDENGVFFWCHAFNSIAPNFKRALSTLNDFSVISLYKNSDGTCSNIYVNGASYFI